MIASRKLMTMLCLALACTVFASSAGADEFDRATKVRLDTAVETPAGVLPPGNYVFRVVPNSNGNIVQVWNEDESKIVATLLTVPDYRLEPADKPILMFESQSASGAPALRAWFYPGEQFGRAFVYPKSKATELAKRTNQSVLSMPDDAASNMKEPAKSVQDAPVAALEVIVVRAVTPSGEEVDKNQAVQPQPNK